MALLDHNGESEFPFSKDHVFNALCAAIPTINGMKIETADKLSGRVVVKSGVSLHSWGENVPIQLSSISENRTQIRITSSPKTGIMFGGAMDMGKNRKNIEQILLATSRILASTQQVINTNLQNHPGELSTATKQENYNFSNVQPASSGWYEKTWLVIVLCLLIFPVGLYALWKNSKINKGWKIAITIFIAIIVFTKLNSEKNIDNESITVTNTEKTEKGSSVTSVVETSPSEKDIIKEKLKVKAQRDWPNDYTTQEYWVNEQLDAYDYMLGIENNSIKKQAQRDWPLDFTTQKYWYNEQIEALERMN